MDPGGRCALDADGGRRRVHAPRHALGMGLDQYDHSSADTPRAGQVVGRLPTLRVEKRQNSLPSARSSNLNLSRSELRSIQGAALVRSDFKTATFRARLEMAVHWIVTTSIRQANS